MFSKYEVYTTVQSIYCYKDSDVLKNKLGIRDREKLKRAEEEFTAVKQFVLLQEPIKGRFTRAHLMHIHRFLFEDIYPKYEGTVTAIDASDILSFNIRRLTRLRYSFLSLLERLCMRFNVLV